MEFLANPPRGQVPLGAISKALDHDRGRREQESPLAQLRARCDSLTPRGRQVMDGVISGESQQGNRRRARCQRTYLPDPPLLPGAQDGRGFTRDLIRMAEKIPP
jgi:hypothetical protein